jgi:hypothetical protein
MRLKKETVRLRARIESDDTRAAYHVAAFRTFLSGRISTFGDKRMGRAVSHYAAAVSDDGAVQGIAAEARPDCDDSVASK